MTRSKVSSRRRATVFQARIAAYESLAADDAGAERVRIMAGAHASGVLPFASSVRPTRTRRLLKIHAAESFRRLDARMRREPQAYDTLVTVHILACNVRTHAIVRVDSYPCWVSVSLTEHRTRLRQKQAARKRAMRRAMQAPKRDDRAIVSTIRELTMTPDTWASK